MQEDRDVSGSPLPATATQHQQQTSPADENPEQEISLEHLKQLISVGREFFHSIEGIIEDGGGSTAATGVARKQEIVAEKQQPTPKQPSTTISDQASTAAAT